MNTACGLFAVRCVVTFPKLHEIIKVLVRRKMVPACVYSARPSGPAAGFFNKPHSLVKYHLLCNFIRELEQTNYFWIRFVTVFHTTTLVRLVWLTWKLRVGQSCTLSHFVSCLSAWTVVYLWRIFMALSRRLPSAQAACRAHLFWLFTHLLHVLLQKHFWKSFLLGHSTYCM